MAAEGSSRPFVAVVGAGPAGLMAAHVLAEGGARVAVFEKMPSPARKFLMAGRGGLNLTHSEEMTAFRARYGAAAASLSAALDAFPPDALRAFTASLGEETFVGSSGRVFPKSFKASPLLRAWLRRLAALGVELRTRHLWQGFAPDGALLFDTPEGAAAVDADAVVLALGGASWPRLGADGGWMPVLAAQGVAVTPFVPANMGVLIPWSTLLRERFVGTPLKRIALTFGGRSVRGEAMVSATGLEGGAVYALSAALRDALAASGGSVRLALDLRPDLELSELAARLDKVPARSSLAERLRKGAGLPPVAVALVNEALAQGWAPRPGGGHATAGLLKGVPLEVSGTAGLARAISSAGGIAFDAIGADFSLKSRPDVFVAGEMIDWEAPTGGYLLQACFATGAAAAKGVLARLSR